MIFFQLLINGLIAGSIYALVAAGFSVIYTTNRFVHFAHGGVVAVCAHIFYSLFSAAGLPLVLSILLTLASGALIGWLIQISIYAPLKKKKASSAVLLIASIALMVLLENVLLIFFGADVKIVNMETTRTGLDLFGARITVLQIIIIFTAILLLFLLWLFARHSRLGKLMRAVADNPELAVTTGINKSRIENLSFVIGSSVAGAASILIALEQNVEATMGTNLIIKGFTGAIVGGVSSLPGSVIGSYLLGLAENFGIWFLPSGYKDAIAFVILIIFLLLSFRGTRRVGGRRGIPACR